VERQLSQKKFVPKGWIHISQDELGSQDEMKKLISKAFRHRKSVIIDRVCVKMKERKTWMTEARVYDVNIFEVVYLDVDIEECKRRVRERVDHPTLSPENGDEVIDKFSQGMAPPESWEGFRKIHHIHNHDELEECFKEISGYNINTRRLTRNDDV